MGCKIRPFIGLKEKCLRNSKIFFDIVFHLYGKFGNVFTAIPILNLDTFKVESQNFLDAVLV